MKYWLLIVCAPCFSLLAQEATSGFDLRATVTGQAVYSHELKQSPRDGAAVAPGFRSMLYPTWKIGKHWSVSGAVEIISSPFFYEDFSNKGYEVKAHILQASINYSRIWKRASVSIRAGQLSSAFGGFLLRYDDASNPLIQIPVGYGYYDANVSTLGLTGAQVDVTAGRWDARAQFVNSSPANPRTIFDTDQYANWTGGLGYTIHQGLRIDASGYRGPYLDRQDPSYSPGESRPKDLPATAVGADVEWAVGHWNIHGEWQHAEMTHHVIPTLRQTAAYVEVKRMIHPRWYIAARAGDLRNNLHQDYDAFESTVGFRPGAQQIIKFGCIVERQRGTGRLSPAAVVQVVTTLRSLSIARN